MFEKITITKTRALYLGRKTFTMVPCNLRPDSFAACRVIPSDVIRTTRENFDKMVGEFLWYNCINNETGRRVAFYINQ